LSAAAGIKFSGRTEIMRSGRCRHDEVRQHDARHLLHAQQRRSEHPTVAGDDAVLLVDQHRVGETELSDRTR
jgi:hypothetical protein